MSGASSSMNLSNREISLILLKVFISGQSDNAISRLLENRTWSSTNKILIRSISFHWQVDTDADSMREIPGDTYSAAHALHAVSA